VISNLTRFPRIAAALRIMVLCMVVLGAILFFKRYHKEWRALALNQSRAAYYGSVLPEYPALAAINAIHDGKGVMPVYNYDDYLITIPFVTAYRAYPTVDSMRADLRTKNIGYVFANNKLDTTENSRAFPELQPKKIIAAANGFYVYKLDW
jgi:hypothetical protein